MHTNARSALRKPFPEQTLRMVLATLLALATATGCDVIDSVFNDFLTEVLRVAVTALKRERRGAIEAVVDGGPKPSNIVLSVRVPCGLGEGSPLLSVEDIVMGGTEVHSNATGAFVSARLLFNSDATKFFVIIMIITESSAPDVNPRSSVLSATAVQMLRLPDLSG